NAIHFSLFCLTNAASRISLKFLININTCFYMANLEINTSQNVNLNYKIVSVGERILAFLIDLFLFFVYFYLVDLVTAAMGMAFSDNWTIFGLQQLLLLPVMFYSLYMHILFNGRTVGKMAMRTRVVKVDGGSVQWSDYL